MASAFYIEKTGGHIRIREDKGSRLIYRRSPGTRGRVGDLAGVER